MKIFTVDKIRRADEYTIKHEPITSFALMERASTTVAQWILKRYPKYYAPVIIAGSGNNGGDGLAVAGLLSGYGYNCHVFLAMGSDGSADFNANLKHLEKIEVEVTNQFDLLKNSIKHGQHLLLIDALFGSGLSRPIENKLATLIDFLNQIQAEKISIDIPSGLYADKSSEGNTIFQADFTLTFQFPKLAFMMPENASSVGHWKVLDIGLHQTYITNETSDYLYIEDATLKQSKKFAHKGDRGRCTIIAGGHGRTGAATLATQAALRSGAGLVTVQASKQSVDVYQNILPEALINPDENEYELGELKSYENQDVLVIGPALGFALKTKEMFRHIIAIYKGKLVLDADALTYISEDAGLLNQLPSQTILTPHIGEFDRLFGGHANHFERLKTLKKVAKQYNLIVVLKGHHTVIVDTSGQFYFNSTGNQGMAKGGSGDVLAGLLGGMLAQRQNINTLQTVISAVHLHGLAGDIALNKMSEFYMLPSNLLENLHLAQKMLMKYNK